MEDIVPFKSGDYIEQNIGDHIAYGFVINYDYLQKKLYYIKISPNSFESFPNPLNNIFDENNKKYRIYDSINGTYCSPEPNTTEIIEQTALPYKPSFVNSFLYVDYIYLDSNERNKFVKTSHEYLIEQIQFNQEIGIKSPNVKQKFGTQSSMQSIFIGLPN